MKLIYSTYLNSFGNSLSIPSDYTIPKEKHKWSNFKISLTAKR